MGALTAGNAVTSSLAAGVTAALFDGGAARAQVRSQEAALEQVRVAYEATVLAALKDVEDALVWPCKATVNGCSACRPQPMPPPMPH